MLVIGAGFVEAHNFDIATLTQRDDGALAPAMLFQFDFYQSKPFTRNCPDLLLESRPICPATLMTS